MTVYFKGFQCDAIGLVAIFTCKKHKMQIVQNTTMVIFSKLDIMSANPLARHFPSLFNIFSNVWEPLIYNEQMQHLIDHVEHHLLRSINNTAESTQHHKASHKFGESIVVDRVHSPPLDQLPVFGAKDRKTQKNSLHSQVELFGNHDVNKI